MQIFQKNGELIPEGSNPTNVLQARPIKYFRFSTTSLRQKMSVKNRSTPHRQNQIKAKKL